MLDDFREWLSDNLRYILLGLAVLLVLIILFCVVRLATGGSKKKPDQGNEQTVVSGQESATEAQVQEEGSQEQATPAKGTSDLVKDDSAILTVMQSYYNAVADRDVATLSQIVEPWNDEVQERAFKSNVEKYENISTYSKQGLETGSYVVFVYFEGKLPDIDTTCPSLTRNYLETGDGGSLKVRPIISWDTDILDYVESVSTDDDVQDLIADVKTMCDEAITKEPALAEFVKEIQKTGSSDEKNAETETDSSANASSEYPKEMEAVTGLNIRQSPSTEANIMGTVLANTNVKVLEDAGDGWVHINYGDPAIDGYVRLEYLKEIVSTDTAA